MEFSADQARAWARIEARSARLRRRPAGGRAAARGRRAAADAGGARPGRVGQDACCSRELVRALVAAGVETVSADYESRRTRTRRTLAVLAPTNKAASVLRGRGVPATTIHRILYTPLYHPDYEAIAEWLTGKGERPKVEGLTEAALDRALAFYRAASVDPRGAGERRAARLGLHQGLEAARRAARHRADRRGLDARRAAVRRPARSCSRTLVLFGDPAQLAPVGGGRRHGLRRAARRGAARAQPGAPAGRRQPDPRPRRRARRPRPRASTDFEAMVERGGGARRRGSWSARGSTPARWRGRRCSSGATRRGCG